MTKHYLEAFLTRVRGGVKFSGAASLDGEKAIEKEEYGSEGVHTPEGVRIG